MEDSYISRRDKIVASAIELIGDLGLHALTPKNLARKQNISDTLIYKYFGGIDEVLIAVVNEYAALSHPYQYSYHNMLHMYLHYEELLHMSETREIISECMLKRNDFVCTLFQSAIDSKEIRAVFSPKELTLMFNGIFTEGLLERRNQYSRKSFRGEIKEMLSHLEKVLRL